MKWTNRLGKMLLTGGAWSSTALALGALGTGCLARPVGTEPPTTKVNFTNTVSQQAVDKVDLLFAIDNSASMGDKQAILAEAVPDLIKGLLNPRCVNGAGEPDPKGTLSDPAGNKANRYGCPDGYDPEFKPVSDMHIGVVSSSLGSFGGNVCDENTDRQNDHGRLLNYGANGPVAEAKDGNFLAWFPQAEENKNTDRHPPPKNPIRQTADLERAFQDLVVGIGQNGCGLEAQLESVYRFLIQPDPWDKVTVVGSQASLGDGVDTTVLTQRADFLRPDSLVAVIMLTDEDDSSADPLAINGQGWAFMSKNFPGSKVSRTETGNGTTAPRGTSACDQNPGDEKCTSCAFQNPKSDPNCTASGDPGKSGDGYDGFYAGDDDDLNVRFYHMKQRYGIDPQYPIRRYIDGFTKPKVPDRTAEHVITNGVIAPYTSTGKCTNPLFATDLPRSPQTTKELCDLKPSSRSPDLVFFAVVGGVPNQLLHFDPNSAENSRIKPEDWTKILGKNSENFDYTGIDPHMVQSTQPRPGLTGADKKRGDNGTDPINGREWNTGKTDLQYACTFDLLTPRTCTDKDSSCDCNKNADNPPLCASGDASQQIKAKAYPTVREFQVVHALGEQGIVASLCPIQLTKKTKADGSPDLTYGYRPAVAAIIDRLKNALTSQCLPQALRPKGLGADGTPVPEVPCLVLVQLADPSETCDKYAAQGLKDVAKPEVLKIFREQQKAESGNIAAGGVDLSTLPVCQLTQVTVQPGDTCKDNPEMVWCYVEKTGGNSPAGPNCAQGLIFSTGTAALPNAKFSLQCINQFAAGEAAGDTSK